MHTLLLNYDGAFEEASRVNNKKVVTKTIQYLPDLLLAVYVSDSTPRIYKNTHFHIDVKNIGKHVSTPVEMSFRLTGKKTKKYQIPALQPNQKKYFTRSVKYGTKGKRSYRITVDTQNTLTEMKKSNNEIKGSIRVLLPTDFDQGGLAYCDLKPEISTDGNNALKGHLYPITVKVSQLGTKKCASSKIRYKDYGNNVQKEYMLPEILPGETYTAVYNLKWSSYGNKLFEVTVDPGNKLQHENKQNNKTHKTIKVW
jgi:subtilase family serine protease